jgi:N-acetylglutamate synthase-like GNAT family acetyltransferase
MIEVQTYKEKYSKEIIELIISIQRGEFNVPITVDDQPDLTDIPRAYQKGKGNFWVAIHEDKVIGTIALIDIGNHEAALRKMFVDKNFRGQQHGVGSALLQTLLSWTVKKEINTIYLGTREEFQASHRFYEKNNFTEIVPAALPASFPKMPLDNKFYKYQSAFK